MFSLKAEEQMPDAGDTPREVQPSQPRRKRHRWWSRRTRRLLELDIGSSRLKAVVLSRRQGDIVLDQAAVAEVSEAAVKHGVLTDGVQVSDEIRALTRDLQIRTRQVATALGGSQVYCQADSLRSEQGDLGPQIESIADRVVPYAIDRAALD